MTHASWLKLTTCFTVLVTVTLTAEVKTLVTGGTIITMEPGEVEPVEGWFTVFADGRILQMGEGEPPADIEADTVVNAAGKIILPGFISAHSHLWSAPFRGIASESNLYAWIAAAHTPFGPYYEETDFYTYTTYGALDFISHGITACYNWVGNTGYVYEHWMEQFEAQLACEQRFIFGWALDVTESYEVNEARLAEFLEKADSLKASHPNMLGVSLSALGLLRGDTHYPWWEGKLMEKYNLDAQAHFLESPFIKHIQHNQWGILKDSGMLCDQLHFAHFIHTTDQILEETVEAGARMVWNPLSNGRLASGLADIPKYKRHGLQIGMGLDGQASGDHSDPFENMRIGMYALRMKYEMAGIMTPYEVLALHTYESAKTLRVEDRIGSLEPGKYADFIILDPLEPDVGPIIDIYATIVMVLSTRNLEGVYIGGEKVYDSGRFMNHDWPAIRDDAHARVDRMISQLREDGGEVPTPTYLEHHAHP